MGGLSSWEDFPSRYPMVAFPAGGCPGDGCFVVRGGSTVTTTQLAHHMDAVTA